MRVRGSYHIQPADLRDIEAIGLGVHSEDEPDDA